MLFQLLNIARIFKHPTTKHNMKKGIILLTLLLLIIPTILAEDVAPKPEEGTSPLSGSLDAKTKNIFEKEIHFPKELNFIKIVIAGIGNDVKKITWKHLMIFVIVTIAVLTFIMGILEFTAFEINWVKITIAGTITIVLIIFGFINKVIAILFGIINNFWILAGVLVLAIVLTMFTKSLLNMVKKQKKISKAEEIGIKSGTVLKGAVKTANLIIETGKKNNL